MHKVEVVLWECPFELSIVEFELQVWRDEVGLDWGEVCPDHGGGGIGVGEVARRDAINLRKQ